MQNLKNQNKSIKILIFGDNNTGKSSLLIRYFQEKFNDNPYQQALDTYEKPRKIGNEEIFLKIWDFDSNQRQYQERQVLIRTFSLAIICYDINNKQTFLKSYDWYLDFMKGINQNMGVLAQIGNKCDLQEDYRQVSFQEVQQFAQSFRMAFFEISAKTYYKVKELFDNIITQTISENYDI
ncbi:hypothetical protein ABPG72_000395 [Tetrahymena utriculariae]